MMEQTAQTDGNALPFGFSPARYNALRTVEDADERLNRGDALAKAEEHLAPIFFAHRVSDEFGINLLHLHWRVGEDELPEQTSGRHHGEKTLVTRPVKRDECTGVPASWMVSSSPEKSERQVFELSTDPQVVSIFNSLPVHHAFLTEAGEVIRRLELADVLGICILPREPLSEDPTDQLLEVTTSDVRSSVVVARPAAASQRGHYIKTCWKFSMASGSNPGQAANGRYQCESRSSCVTKPVPIGPPNHVSKTSHEHVDVE